MKMNLKKQTNAAPLSKVTSPTINTTIPATATENAMGTPNARHP